MSYGGAFSRLTLSKDGKKLHVEGVATKDPEDVEELYFLLPLRNIRQSVSIPSGGTEWEESLHQDNPPFAVGDRELVVGVAVRRSEEPFVWHDMLTIEAQGGG